MDKILKAKVKICPVFQPPFSTCRYRKLQCQCAPFIDQRDFDLLTLSAAVTKVNFKKQISNLGEIVQNSLHSHFWLALNSEGENYIGKLGQDIGR